MSDNEPQDPSPFRKTAARKQRPYRKKQDEAKAASSNQDLLNIKKGDDAAQRGSQDMDATVSAKGDWDEASDTDNSSGGLTLQEALELRKLRRPKAGISAANLEIGAAPLRHLKEKQGKQAEEAGENDDPWKLKSGGGLINMSDVRGRNFGEEGSGTGGFETASTAMDTEKHMREFVENELKKRRGDAPSTTADTLLPVICNQEDGLGKGPIDYDEELFRIPDSLTIIAKPIKEDNVTLSSGMLTAIPEVDLGVSNKLKNIEETERTKRSLLEKGRKVKTGDIVLDTLQKTRFMSTERFWGSGTHSNRGRGGHNDRGGHNNGRGRHPNQNNDDRDRSSTQADGSLGSGGTKIPRRMMATDMMVMEKFKKRMRR
ncbi:hypothetical protein BASA81_015335 [Batrachochytrium salamandrivorans]|nr:hypothetical protein BASA62_001119 [Batrachochytrium salamandrivorans]KAH9247087.1 hypothetical protein BASA81_015335 [Batrachochytrium salamandrivorans]